MQIFSIHVSLGKRYPGLIGYYLRDLVHLPKS